MSILCACWWPWRFTGRGPRVSTSPGSVATTIAVVLGMDTIEGVGRWKMLDKAICCAFVDVTEVHTRGRVALSAIVEDGNNSTVFTKDAQQLIPSEQVDMVVTQYHAVYTSFVIRVVSRHRKHETEGGAAGRA